MIKIIAVIFSLFFSIYAYAESTAAHVAFVSGKAWAKTNNSTWRTLNENDVIYSGDRLATAKKSKLEIKFTDGSEFNLGADTTMDISDYEYKSAKKANSFSSRIIKGTFRFISGLIASKSPKTMSVRLPVATIGIRGTHVVAEVTSTSAKVILLEPKEDKPTSIIVSNDFGSVVVDKVGYGTEVPDEFSPPSPMQRMQLRTIDNLMRSIQNSQRMVRPRLPH